VELTDKTVITGTAWPNCAERAIESQLANDFLICHFKMLHRGICYGCQIWAK